MTVYKTIFCTVCGVEDIKRGPMQKYCRECSSEKDVARRYRTQPEKRSSKLAAVGKKISAAHTGEAKMGWLLEPAPPMTRSMRIKMPFTYSYSKNAIWSMGGRGHVYVREDIKALKNDMVERLREASHAPWFEGKVYVDIFVEKPDAKGDAINVVDFVCDAVKQAIEVDDRWFSITRLDWSVCKNDPHIYIGVAQAVEEHHRVCSYCGRVLPLTASFTKRKGMRLGYGRECKECVSAARKEQRRAA